MSAVLQDSDAPRQATRRSGITLPQVFSLVTLALLIWGYRFPTEQYLTPQSGAGYAFGILGGSAMLLLLVYPLRKRMRWLAFMGTTKRWFQAHMALGVVGPVLVLFHANFSLGATNSNVALACMLIVSGSGLFGRYFYTRIHHGLHGRKANLAELRAYAEKLRWVTSNVDFLPGLVGRIEVEEQRIVGRCERTLLLARPLVGAVGVLLARRRLRHYVTGALRASAATAAPPRRTPQEAEGRRAPVHRPPPGGHASRRRVRCLRTPVLALACTAPAAVRDAARCRHRARRRGARLLTRWRRCTMRAHSLSCWS